MTIHAYTEPGVSSPAYININERVSNPGDVIITVRSAGENSGSSIILNREQLRGLVSDAEKHLDGAGLKLPADHPVSQIATAGGGTVDHVARMPDGSGAATISFPLPENHWLTKPGYDEPPMGFRKGTDDPERAEWAEKIRAAGRYAMRGATMNGTEDDIDPDALVQNLVVGMLGYFTPDGLSRLGEPEAPADTSGLPG